MTPEIQPIRLGQLELRFFVDGSHTAGAYSVAEMIVPPGARTPPPHAHGDIDELVYGVAGALDYTIDGVTTVVTPGVRAFSPRGKAHGFENRGSVPAHVLLTFSPATVFGPQYFRDVAALMVPGQPPDFAKVRGVMERYGLVIATPPPSA
jgi:quercetin dioxygenase-like cupin family protein